MAIGHMKDAHKKHGPKTCYRAVWLSDVHLGTKDCQIEKLLRFLSSIHCDYLYLLGDIIDVWSLRRKWYWPSSHNDAVRKIIKREIKGTRIIFVPGNHDEIFRDYDGMNFGGVAVMREAIHVTADGRRILCIHGDEFDAVVTNAKLITAVGDWLYYVLLRLNRAFNRVRRRFGRPYWSMAGFIKDKVKSVLQFVNDYEGYVARAARERGVDAVICGHIHRPEIREIGNVTYCNCGDWVENCTAIVETIEGDIRLLDLKSITDADHALHKDTGVISPRRNARRLGTFTNEEQEAPELAEIALSTILNGNEDDAVVPYAGMGGGHEAL